MLSLPTVEERNKVAFEENGMNRRERIITVTDERGLPTRGGVVALVAVLLLSGCASQESSIAKSKGIKGDPVAESLEVAPDVLWGRISSLGGRFREDGYKVGMDPNAKVMTAAKIDASTIQFGLGKVVIRREYRVAQEGNRVSVWVHEYKLPYSDHIFECRKHKCQRFEPLDYEDVPDDLLAVDKYVRLGDRTLGRDYNAASNKGRQELIRAVTDSLRAE